MKIFKFGGASVKDADGVRNVASILRLFPGENIVVIVSAMGKTTNALEVISQTGYEGKENAENIASLYNYHKQIIGDLGIHVDLDYFIDLVIQQTESRKLYSFPHYYDQVVSIGELISSSILSAYLNDAGLTNEWTDVRDLILTDQTWREGFVDWDKTAKKILAFVPEKLKTTHIVTQGFLGKTWDGSTTTLGREGSDYTGAIFANILDAEGLWIWKDVPGVLNADPKIFPDAVKLPELTYYEAIEMTFYGASVIHPKTIQPLQQKLIPLYVKSFMLPEADGTVIKTNDKFIDYPSVVMYKKNQTLISIIPSYTSFVGEMQMANIYSIFQKHKLKINVIQIAAQSVSIVVDFNKYIIEPVIAELKEFYSDVTLRENNDLELLTIRHYNAHILLKLTENKKILLEQQTRNTVQFLYE
ncbi:MAG: aspartate kinase [Chitinophagales bacterium]